VAHWVLLSVSKVTIGIGRYTFGTNHYNIAAGLEQLFYIATIFSNYLPHAVGISGLKFKLSERVTLISPCVIEKSSSSFQYYVF